MLPNPPYISFIIVVRNDNYGRDFNRRLQMSIDWLLYLLNKYSLEAEVLLINYNPLEDQPGLDKIIKIPGGVTKVAVRMITVGVSAHKKLLAPDIRKTLPVFEFIAKNIGIRRAKGKYVLCTNADILFSENMIAYFAKKQLLPGVLYRCDRYDFKLKAWDFRESAEKLGGLESLIQKRSFKFFMQGGTFKLPFPRSLKVRLGILTRYNAFRKFYYKLLLNTPGRRFFLFLPKIPPELFFVFNYHCNASGDMTLMDRRELV